MIDFRSVRERVTAEDAARLYGLEFDRRGRAVCPFHQDKHPSISFKGGRFRCWACGANGDSLDFTARLFNLDSVQAAEKLNTDFHLGFSKGAKGNPETLRMELERRWVSTAHQGFEEWRERTMNSLNEVCYIANKATENGTPWTMVQALAVRYQAQAEYFSDLLAGDGAPEEQAQLYRERRRLERWIAQILKGC